MSKKADEKTKLLATALNGAAVTCFTVGVVAPIVAVVVNLGGAGSNVPTTALVINAIFWLSTAAVLQLIARRVLDGLSE